MDILTGGEFRPNEWTRVSVKQGHEDDTLLTFFENGRCWDPLQNPMGTKMAPRINRVATKLDEKTEPGANKKNPEIISKRAGDWTFVVSYV